jgi:hypothetical protein
MFVEDSSSASREVPCHFSRRSFCGHGTRPAFKCVRPHGVISTLLFALRQSVKPVTRIKMSRDVSESDTQESIRNTFYTVLWLKILNCSHTLETFLVTNPLIFLLSFLLSSCYFPPSAAVFGRAVLIVGVLYFVICVSFMNTLLLKLDSRLHKRPKASRYRKKPYSN